MTVLGRRTMPRVGAGPGNAGAAAGGATGQAADAMGGTVYVEPRRVWRGFDAIREDLAYLETAPLPSPSAGA